MFLAGVPEGFAKRHVQLHAPRSRRRIDLAGGIEGLARHAVLRRGFGCEGDGETVLRHLQRASHRVPPREYSPDDRLCGTSIMKPEFRPAGPLPTSRASSTTILSSGRSWISRRAADRPAKPAPMISQSAVTLPSRLRTGKERVLIASQPETPVSTGRRLTGFVSSDRLVNRPFGHSIQIVFSSVYLSWAKIDLSRPPKPDSL